MEIFGKRWQLRLLAGLLAIFVTLYFTADLFGGIRADDTPTIGESGEDEEIAEEDEIMLLALDRAGGEYEMKTPFEITKVEVKINGTTLTEGAGGEAVVKTGDTFSLKFEWEMLDGQSHKFETFYYDLTEDLKGIKLNETTPPGEPVDFTLDGIYDAYYEVIENVLILRIEDTKNFKKYTGGFEITGTVDLNKAPNSTDGKFTIKFSNKTFNLIRADKIGEDEVYLSVSKTANGDPEKDANGDYWQNFTITVTNTSTKTAATDVVIKDTFGNLFGGSSPAIDDLTVNSDGSYTVFPISIPEIEPGDSVTITYKVKLDPSKIISGKNNNDQGNSNQATATAHEMKNPSYGWASVSRIPSFKKSGMSYDANKREITWEITVNPGFLDGEDWTVTDQGQTWSKDKGWNKKDGVYTRTYKTTVPPEVTFLPVENTATFTAGKLSANATAAVSIPTLSKNYDAVTLNGNEATVPWKITVKIPNMNADEFKNKYPGETIQKITVTDYLTDAWQYAGQNSRIENIYRSFEVIDGNGKAWPASSIDGNSGTVSGVGTLKKTYYAENVRFQLEIDNPQFLRDNAGKDVTISYKLNIKDATISEVTNHVETSVELSNNTKLNLSADSTYQRDVIVKKEQDYSGPAAQYPNLYNVHSWKVTLTNNTGGSNSDIVFVDTLPDGYELCKRANGNYELRLTNSSGTEIPYKKIDVSSSGTGSGKIDTFTVTVDKSYSGQQTLYLYYTAYMTSAHYNTLAGQTQTYLPYINEIEAKVGSVSGSDTDTFYVNAPTSNPHLTKGILHTSTLGADYTAAYQIKINENKENLGSNSIKVTDYLGSAMVLDESSVQILKFTGSNVWDTDNDWTTVSTADAGYKYDPSKNTITFNLENKTYYQITYQVEGKRIGGDTLTDTNDPLVQQELQKRFGNMVELEAAGANNAQSKVMLSQKTYRQSASFQMLLDLSGVKEWDGTPAGTAEPTEITLDLTRTEALQDGTQVSAVTYTFKLKKDGIVEGTSTNPADFLPTVERNGKDWSFIFENLPLRNASLDSTYTYQLTEQNVTNYNNVAYYYKTNPTAPWSPAANQAIGIDTVNIDTSDSGEIDVKITNTYTGNKPVVSTLYIDKKDMTGTEQLADAQLTIRNTDGTNLSGVTVTGTKTPVTPSGTTFSFTTTDQRVTIKGLPEGNYELEEKIAPSGYTVTTKFYFTIDKNGNVTKTNGKDNGTVNSLTGNTITLKDQAIKLTIRKTDKTTGSLLPGAEFTLTATSPSADLTNAPIDIVGATFVPEGITKNSFTFITRANDVTIEGIPAGPYTLEEKKAPNRYKKSGTGIISFTISPNGTITGYPNNTITVQNELITADLTVEKVDDIGNALSGAEFTLKAGSAVDWTRVTFGSTKGSGNSTSYKFPVNNGNLVIKGLPIGKYTLTETKVPSNHLQTQSFNFEVTSTGAITSADMRYVSANKITLIDKQANSGTIEIIKVDRDDGTLLDGAEFELTRVDDDVISYQTEAGTVTSSADGKTLTLTTQDGEARISGLAAGEYIIKETKAPSGYILSAAPQNVTLTSNGTGVSSDSISIENEATEISINKVDMTAGGKQLEGAKLTIRNTGGTNLSGVTVTGADSVTPNGSTISFTTTGETATIKGLPEGNYELEETVAPSGYIVTTKFYFTMDKNGNVTKTNGKDNGTVNSLTGNEITLKDKPTEIFIKKVDMTNSDQLPGATLLIQGKRGADFSNVKVSGAISSRVDKINSRVTLVTGNEDAKVQGLPAGDYELTETVAPTGYEKTTTKFSFKIGTDGKASAAGGSDITLNGNTITVKDAPEKEKPNNPNDPVKPTDPTDPWTPGGNTPGGNTPGGNTPGGNTPGGNTPGGNTPGGNTPGSSSPADTKPADGSDPASTTTTVRNTVTEPDELEPEKTTKQTTSKVPGTTAPDAAVTTTVPDGAAATTTTTTTAPTGTVTTGDEPGSGIDSNQTAKDDNPHTAVPFTSLAAVFVAAGTLAVVTQKKKNK